jgi:hypothetical protein
MVFAPQWLQDSARRSTPGTTNVKDSPCKGARSAFITRVEYRWVSCVSSDASSFVRLLPGSVYTDRMPAQPSVRVMKKEPDVYEVEVAAAQPTLHCITAEVGDVEYLTSGKASAERLIEESFRFLLERESNTSILRSFRITDISRYFPEYEREIRRRLAR